MGAIQSVQVLAGSCWGYDRGLLGDQRCCTIPDGNNNLAVSKVLRELLRVLQANTCGQNRFVKKMLSRSECRGSAKVLLAKICLS